MTKKVMKTYFLVAFIYALTHSFFFATYSVFLKDKGMDLFQMNVISAFFMAAVFFLEVPTGAFADVFGRKKSIIAGFVFFSLATLVYYLSGSFWMFIVAELIAALSVSFISGSMEAWAVDSLNHHGYDGDLGHVFKRHDQFRQGGILIGSVVGAYAGNFDIALPWLMCSIGTLFLAGISALIVREEYFVSSRESVGLASVRKTAAESIKYGFHNKAVWLIIVFSAVFSFSIQTFNMHWQILFQDSFGLAVSHLGWVFAATCVFIMIGNHLSLFWRKIIKNEKNAMITSQAVTAAGMIAAASMWSAFPVMAAFMIHEMGRGMFGPLKQAYLNRRIPSKTRATVISFESMIARLGCVGGLLVSGALAENYSISLAWFVSGVVLAVSIAIFLKIKNGD